VGAYLDAWLAGRVDLKPGGLRSAREAVSLYWKPALGHVPLTDLRDHHIAAVITELGKINRVYAGPVTEMGRRLAAARAVPASGRKSTMPLGPARILRVTVVLRAALNAAVPSRIAVSPARGVSLPRMPRRRPLAWTAEREEPWREDLAQRVREAEAASARPLTAAQREELWHSPAHRPAPVMVWLPEHTGAFLDFTAADRMAALFALAAYCGLRRGEALGLTWPSLDLAQGIAYVTVTADSDDPKSDAGVRVVALPPIVVTALREWRAWQDREREEWGPGWQPGGAVFTRADGSAERAQYVARRFATLSFRAGIPPVRFHDLRHGAASLCKAAKLDTKYISEMLGHSRTSFTDATYVLLFPDVAQAAAAAAAAVVPRAQTRS
jgi:integrase